MKGRVAVKVCLGIHVPYQVAVVCDEVAFKVVLSLVCVTATYKFSRMSCHYCSRLISCLATIVVEVHSALRDSDG